MHKMDITGKEYIIKDKRPAVLLLGNGLTYNKDTSWSNIIGKLSRTEAPKLIDKDIPYSIQASIETSVDDLNRYNKYQKYFENDYPYKEFPVLERLVNLDVDAILTTNYTYEIERCFVKNFNNLASKGKKTKYSLSTNPNKDKKYMLRTFNRFVENNGKKDIWHIHGEVRRKSSIILTHDEYSHLIEKLVDYNKNIGKDYVNSNKIIFNSWFDYFVLGDVYIVGQGMSFSEFDLWWLISRRVKEKDNIGTGKLYFFNPLAPDGKETAIEKALLALGAIVERCDVKLTDDANKNNELYSQFYNRATDKIEILLKGK